MMNPYRTRLLQEGKKTSGPVCYWMSRDQRINDNWALISSMELAKENRVPAVIAFVLQPEFLNAAKRQYYFMLKGLRELEQEANQYGIDFIILTGPPEKVLPEFIASNDISALVCDFDPLRIKRVWKRELAKNISVPFYETDAHNIVPCLFVSQKEEYAAYTIRPKIHRFLPEFLDNYPETLPECPRRPGTVPSTDWNKLYASHKFDETAGEVSGFQPGEKAATEMLEKFLNGFLSEYNAKRNDPNADFQSNLSPYIHFGQISAQRIALEVRKRFAPDENTEAFLEELIVRRELSDNFCYYNTRYDSTDGFQKWAKASIEKHRADRREFLYTTEDFEHARTHDDLWNSAQLEMTRSGKMHGYLRMYWAKKILEWTDSVETALKTAIYLNDKYQLDGRDANGYTGCAWSIGGVHDRAWVERPVFGQIRYMNFAGCKRKFDVPAYIKKVNKINTQ